MSEKAFRSSRTCHHRAAELLPVHGASPYIHRRKEIMRLLMDKRCAGLVAAVAAFAASSALFFAPAAGAGFSPCNDGFSNDHQVFLNNNDTYIGAETPSPSPTVPPSQKHGFVCVAPTGGEANQTWVQWAVVPAPSGSTGYTVQSYRCHPGGPCGTATLAPTGAYVDNNATSTNGPGAAEGNGTGGSVGTGSATCVRVHGASTCPSGLSIANVTVEEEDAPKVEPSGSGWRVVVGNDPDQTVQGTVAGIPVGHDLPRNCVVAVLSGSC